jgi:hypothetical protein
MNGVVARMKSGIGLRRRPTPDCIRATGGASLVARVKPGTRPSPMPNPGFHPGYYGGRA